MPAGLRHTFEERRDGRPATGTVGVVDSVYTTVYASSDIFRSWTLADGAKPRLVLPGPGPARLEQMNRSFADIEQPACCREDRGDAGYPLKMLKCSLGDYFASPFSISVAVQHLLVARVLAGRQAVNVYIWSRAAGTVRRLGPRVQTHHHHHHHHHPAPASRYLPRHILCSTVHCIIASLPPTHHPVDATQRL